MWWNCCNRLPPRRRLRTACRHREHRHQSGLLRGLRGHRLLRGHNIGNAGINTDLRNLHDIPLETWQEVVEINLNSVYYVIRELLPHLRSNQQGHIINIISGAGYSLRPNATSGVAYIASKHGVTGLSHAINSEEWENGIRCSAVYPGEVDTAMLDTDHQRLQPGEAEMVMQPEDIAAAVVFAARTHPRALVADVYMQPSRHRNR